jgi:hypothetical protein
VAYSTSQMCEALITAIESVTVPAATSAHVLDRLQGRVGPPLSASDRVFGIIPLSASRRRYEETDIRQHVTDVEIVIYYADGEGAYERIADDGELITEALESLRNTDADNIIHMDVAEGDPIGPSDTDGYLWATRTITVGWYRA